MGLSALELTPRIGSQVMLSVTDLMSGNYVEEIRELLVKRGVLVFRDMKLTTEQHREFAASLGDLRLGTTVREGEEGLMKVTMEKEKNPDYAEFFVGSMLWHMDGTYDEVPPFASILRPEILANEGGETEFASTYAAYEDLPEDEKEHLETLRVAHTMPAAMFHAVPTPSLELYKLWLSYPQRVHPLVWHHKSGKKSLALSTSASHIVDMHPIYSYELLQRLMHHATQPAYVYRHEWRLNDLLIWDNTGTMHRGRPFDMESGRTLNRFTLNGEEPIRGVA